MLTNSQIINLPIWPSKCQSNDDIWGGDTKNYLILLPINQVDTIMERLIKVRPNKKDHKII
jgi:hypothetical protein